MNPSAATWPPGSTPVAVVLLSLNEAHNLRDCLTNLSGFAQEVFLVDSHSRDETIDIALEFGVHVVQRKFRGFGDQWNFALSELPIEAPWTMKLDPDERLDEELKKSIRRAIGEGRAGALSVTRRLFFMGRPLPVDQELVRLWKTGTCRFSDVLVNEHPLVQGKVASVPGQLEHHDSPNLHHWFAKQNSYSTTEALTRYRNLPLAADPKLLGTPLERRMWLKSRIHKVPFRFFLLFWYHYLVLGTFRAGRAGLIWAHLRADVHRHAHFKFIEMHLRNRELSPLPEGVGEPDARVAQY